MSIPKGMLEGGEKVLWSHIIEAPAKADKRKDNIIAQRFFRIISMTLYIVSVIAFYQAYTEAKQTNGLSQMVKTAIQAGVISAVLGVGTTLLSRTKWMKNLQRTTERPVFQNGFVTDRRVVFFNHFNKNIAVYRAPDIKRAAIDFENGGYALKIVPLVEGLPSVLVGGTDFRKAKTIIDEHLL